MNVVLIGMPGCGKSTVGVVLAKKLGFRFVDSDIVIQDQTGRLLQDIIDSSGLDAFLQAEEAALTSIKTDCTVIATGGSAVYSARGMEHLKQNGIVVYINLALDEIEQRLDDTATRGIAGAEKMTLDELYDERVPLYEKYADITVDANGCRIEQALAKVYAEVCKVLDK